MSILGRDLAAALPELRVEAESLMVTPCVMERRDGHTIDPDNHHRTDRWVEAWSGLCRVVTSREAREITVGGQKVTVKPTNVRIPWDTEPRAVVGDRFTTGEGVFYVAGVEHDTWAVQQRYTCAEHQG